MLWFLLTFSSSRLKACDVVGYMETTVVDELHSVCTSNGKCTSTACLLVPERCSFCWRWLAAFMSVGRPMLIEQHILEQFLLLKNRAGLVRPAYIWHEKRRGRVLFLWTDEGLMKELGFRRFTSSSIEDTPVTSMLFPALHPVKSSDSGNLVIEVPFPVQSLVNP